MMRMIRAALDRILGRRAKARPEQIMFAVSVPLEDSPYLWHLTAGAYRGR